MTLDTKEGIDKFVSENLNDLLEKLNETYGPILFEELKNRIMFTIDEFNQEMSDVFSQLKVKENERQKMYNMIKSGNIPSAADSESDNEDLSSSWEQKIEEIESNK